MNELVGVLGAATIAGVVGYVTARLSRPKITAEAIRAQAEAEATAAETMREAFTQALELRDERIRALEDAMNEVRQELATVLEQRDKYREENHIFQKGTDILRGQVRELGGVPRWPD